MTGPCYIALSTSQKQHLGGSVAPGTELAGRFNLDTSATMQLASSLSAEAPRAAVIESVNISPPPLAISAAMAATGPMHSGSKRPLLPSWQVGGSGIDIDAMTDQTAYTSQPLGGQQLSSSDVQHQAQQQALLDHMQRQQQISLHQHQQISRLPVKLEDIPEPTTPQEADRLVQQQEGSFDDDASSPSSDVCKGSRAPSPDPALSLNGGGLPRPTSVTSSSSILHLAGVFDASQAAMQQQTQSQQQLFQSQLAQHSQPQQLQEQYSHHQQYSQGVNVIPPGVVGTFFPVERPRPPPAGDQVNFAQRIMEICFSAATNWPMNLALQFVVDGVPRGAPVDVTVGRSICKSQVSGSRQVIYYVRNPPLLRLARSFDARTIGYRLAGPTTLEWHLSTAPAPPAVAPVAKGPGRRKVGGKAARSQYESDDWAPMQHAPGGGAQHEQPLLAQQMLLLQQLGGMSGGAPAAAAALQQQLASAPPALIGQLAQWLGAQQLAPGGSSAALAAAMASAAGAQCLGRSGAQRIKRRKQPRPSRAPFYGQQLCSQGVYYVLPCLYEEARKKVRREMEGAAAAALAGGNGAALNMFAALAPHASFGLGA